jgi:hypothetical protein
MNKGKFKLLGIGIAILFLISYGQHKELKDYDSFLEEKFLSKHKNEIEREKQVLSKTLRDIDTRSKFYDFFYTEKKNNIKSEHQSGLISTEQMMQKLNELDKVELERSLEDLIELREINIPEYKTPSKTEKIMTLWMFIMIVSIMAGIVVIVGIIFEK